MPAAPPASVLTTAAPAVGTGEAERLALEHFGVRAAATRPLIGERDSNFHLVADDGREYLLKVLNPAEDPAVTAFQVGALEHVAVRDPLLPVPRVVRTVGGAATAPFAQAGVQAGEPPRQARMMTFLQGRPLAQAERGPALRRSLGAGLARLDLALAGYAHPAARSELLWDLSHASKLRPLLRHVDAAGRGPAERALDRFEAHVVPAMPRLRAQVIHNDFNPYNVLVHGAADEPEGERLAGIIDFGDMVEAALVNDLGVAASYHVEASGPFLDPVLDLVAAYHAVLPLREDEIAALCDVMVTRMLLTVIISSWRAALQPDNRAYILRNAGRAAAGLARAGELGEGEAAALIRARLKEEARP